MWTAKDPDELELIKTICALNDHGYALSKLLAVPGKREVDVYSEVHQELCKKVGTFQYSAGDSVSGKRSLYIGGPPTDKVSRGGETFIIGLWGYTRSTGQILAEHLLSAAPHRISR